MPNVLLCVFDCLRKDYWDKRMPKKDAVIDNKGWTVFENHWSVAHCSDPNFSTMLSGQPPWVTGITTQMGIQFHSVSMLSMPLLFSRELAWYAWAIEPVKCPRFYHMFDEIAWQKTEQSSDLELRPIEAFLRQAGRRNWFGFIRDMTTHYPYNEHPCPPRGSGGDIIPQYEDAVDHVDQFIHNLWVYLQKEAPDTIIVLAADHGELLGEHGEWDHLYTLYSYLTHVPFAVYMPEAKYKSRSTKALTQHTDVYPTLLNAAGLKMRTGPHNLAFPGISLWPYVSGKMKKPPISKGRTIQFQGIGAGPATEDDLDDRMITNVIDPGIGRSLWRHRGVISDGYKAVHNVHVDGANEYKLTRPYDYGETKTLKWGEKHDKLRNMMPPIPDYYDWQTAAIVANQQGAVEAAREAAKNDEIVMQRLRDLGYA